MNDSPTSVAGSRLQPSDWIGALLLFASLLGIYQLNTDFYIVGDSMLNILVAQSIWDDHDLSFRAEEIPDYLDWTLATSKGKKNVAVRQLDDYVRRLIKDGELSPSQHVRPMTALADGPSPNCYVSVFMPGASITAAPWLGLRRILRGKMEDSTLDLHAAGRLVAGACTALSAVFLFLTFRLYLSLPASLFLAAAYGLGTCVWSTSSQSLWQHGPNEMYLSMGAYFLHRGGNKIAWTTAASLAFSAATWCRPTSAIFAIAGIALLRGKSVAVYIMAAIPFAALMMYYNHHFFGSPFVLGESVVVDDAAIVSGGNRAIWQTSFGVGLHGLLLSPGRGLLSHSPFLIFSFVGAWFIWRDSRFKEFRAWTIAVLFTWCIHFVYYDWWGGFSFGYRPIVDTVPYLMLMQIPIFARARNRWSAASFGVYSLLLAFSIYVQVLGVWAFDLASWNNRRIYQVAVPHGETFSTYDKQEAELLATQKSGRVEEIALNIDLPEYRWRIGVWSESPIPFYTTHFWECRRHRKDHSENLKVSDRYLRSITDAEIARAWLDDGNENRAREALLAALKQDPRNDVAVGLLARLRVAPSGESVKP